MRVNRTKESFKMPRNRKTSYVLLINVFIFVLFVIILPGGEKTDPSLLDLDRLFKDNEFFEKRFGPARWWKDGVGYTTLESSSSTKDGKDIVSYQSKTGNRSVMVPCEKLIPFGQSNPIEIEDYEWSPDRKLLMIFTNSKKVWRQNTRGDYWVLNLKTWKLFKLGGDFPSSTLMFAKFSPTGDRVAYVQKNNIFVENIFSHKLRQLTEDGSTTTINGTFDWVYEEEFSLRDGFRWSPDGKLIAYWQMDTTGVRDFFLINNTDSIYSQVIPIQYPKAGETNSACRIGVVNTSGGTTQWFKVPGDPRNHYIARMDWADNSKEIVFQQLNRLQNTNKVMLGDATIGSVHTMIREKDDAWLDVVDDLKWFYKGKSFTWVSESDGWRHIYLVSRTGKKKKILTPGNYDIISIQSIDEKNGWIYFIASPENPTQRYLFRVPIKGKGKARRITPGDQKGTHRYDISPNGKWAFHTYSTFDTPPVTQLIHLPGHQKVRILEDNSELRAKVNQLHKRPAEFFRVDIGDQVLLDAWCMKPTDFDPGEKYPILFFVYGEPWSQTVLDKWSRKRYLWHLMLNQKGFLVMSIDNRGTPSPQGRAWRKSIYRQVGILASEDQAAAVKSIIKTRPYVDSKRIGIWGWSGGGSMSLNAIFRYPKIYHMAMSVAPVSNQRYYNTIYQERYMGLPKDNPGGYKNGSPITYAHQLKGKLLLVHGTGDDNVHYQSAEALINELIKNNKLFSLMSYPNRSHSISEGENTTRHLYTLLTTYLMENLLLGPKEGKAIPQEKK
jgi:dipeptidyl-peptidase-4